MNLDVEPLIVLFEDKPELTTLLVKCITMYFLKCNTNFELYVFDSFNPETFLNEINAKRLREGKHPINLEALTLILLDHNLRGNYTGEDINNILISTSPELQDRIVGTSTRNQKYLTTEALHINKSNPTRVLFILDKILKLEGIDNGLNLR